MIYYKDFVRCDEDNRELARQFSRSEVLSQHHGERSLMHIFNMWAREQGYSFEKTEEWYEDLYQILDLTQQRSM